MNQWLSRGYEIQPNTRIRRLLAVDNDWQIYDTNNNSHVLIISTELHSVLKNTTNAPLELFSLLRHSKSYYYIVTKPGYIIASLEKGPFPKDSLQIEAFALTFNNTRKFKYNLEKALYIEEFSLILPTQSGECKEEIVFGKWITGGVGVSIKDFNQISKIISWLPPKHLQNSLQIAGFKFDNANEEIKIHKEEQEDTLKQLSEVVRVPEEDFKLTGRKDLERFLNDNIIDVLRNADEYNRMGIEFPGATILFGPPGCGKTFAIDKLTDFLGWERFDINSNTIGSPYIHETGKKIVDIFDTAISMAPSIIVIDEMEAYLSRRENQHGHVIEEMSEFLRKIPEAVSKGVLIFAMTNMIESIDPAILRRGRFDYLIEIEMAGEEEIVELLKEKFKSIPVDKNITIKDIACKLVGRPLSDITFVLREAGKIAVKRQLEYINIECFNNAIDLLPEGTKQKRKIGFN